MNAKTPPVAFKTIHEAMLAYAIARGEKCDAWKDFSTHCRKQYGKSPAYLSGNMRVSRVCRLLARGGGLRQPRLRLGNGRVDQ
jgi:hypothetical protein